MRLRSGDGYHNFFPILPYILQNDTTHNLSLKLVRKFGLAHGLYTLLHKFSAYTVLYIATECHCHFTFLFTGVLIKLFLCIKMYFSAQFCTQNSWFLGQQKITRQDSGITLKYVLLRSGCINKLQSNR